MSVDGAPTGSVHVPLAMRIMSSIGHSIGFDHGSAVSPRYAGANPFTGELHEVEIVLAGRPDALDAAAASAETMARQ
jgi:arylsulfatase